MKEVLSVSINQNDSQFRNKTKRQFSHNNGLVLKSRTCPCKAYITKYIIYRPSISSLVIEAYLIYCVSVPCIENVISQAGDATQKYTPILEAMDTSTHTPHTRPPHKFNKPIQGYS